MNIKDLKPGDKVICTNDLKSQGLKIFTLNKVYTVVKIYDKCFEFVADDGHTSLSDASCFELYNGQTIETTKSTLINSSTTLPTDSTDRKNYPVLSGCIKYFPAALAGVARISKLGNDKHNPGQPLHHARGKSMDHGDCIVRHLIDTEDLLAAMKRGDSQVTKEQVLLEASQLAWRALAYAQMIHEQFGSPLAPGAET